MARIASLLGALLVLGCDKRPVQAVADPAGDAPRPAPPPDATVLPLVSGCGCAYQCARGLRVRPDGAWDVTHDLLDSATVRASIERWCFDAKGHAYPELGAPKEATECKRVFFDGTPCGGECIPTTTYVRCRS